LGDRQVDPFTDRGPLVKDYQKKTVDTPKGPAAVPGLAVPDRVSVAMAEIAGNMGEGLLALAVGAGLQVMQALMDADVTARWPGSRASTTRTGPRSGTAPGRVRSPWVAAGWR